VKHSKPRNFAKALLHWFIVLVGALSLTLVFFLVLPLMQRLSERPQSDLIVQSVDTANIPPPPPPPEQEPEEEEEPEDEPPELSEEAPPLDLSQLELALNPGFNQGWMAGDYQVDLKGRGAGGDDVDALFSMADLDQRPRVISQPSPLLTPKLRRKAPGTVYIIFIVNKQGRVENPIVQRSTDPIFERPALAAVKQWKFEPGKRQGEPVRFRMRVPITFPKGQ
jgi:protein TonB